MPLKFTQRNAEEVPSAGSNGKINQDLVAIKNEMAKLGSGMVLEIDTGSEKAVRGTKMLITKASKELGTQWKHWHSGTSVYAQPVDAAKRRGRPRKTE
jgi:hypothetical protein